MLPRLCSSACSMWGRDGVAAAALPAAPVPRAASSQRRQPGSRSLSPVAAAAAAGSPSYGLFVCSGSPEVTEAMAAAAPDWMCLDAQHAAVPYDRLKAMLCAAGNSSSSKLIVRVGGPGDRFGIQQALDLGGDGVMVPLINSKADAEEAVSYCLYPPQGQRSVAGDIGAVFKRGTGVAVLSEYLKSANKEVEVWLQVETRQCFEALDEVLSVPGITCAFLGPADMGFSFGLHVQQDYDLPAMMASPDMQQIYGTVVEACRRHGVQPGVFCLGEERAAELASVGYRNIAFNTDLSVLVNYTVSSMNKLKSSNFSI